MLPAARRQVAPLRPARAFAWSSPLRRRLRAACAGAIVACAGVHGEAGAADVAPWSLAEVAPGVWVHVGAVADWTPAAHGDVANLGFIVGSRCVAVIDTGGTPAVGRALRAAIERTTPLPVCYVVNTHAHPDHVLGNEAFVSAGAAPRFVASARYGRALAARAPHYLNALRRDFGIGSAAIVPPSLVVDGVLELDLGERVVQLRSWPTAHTDNDLTVLDRRTGTLFASDLLFVDHLPVLDGSLRGWLAALAALKRLDVAAVVPGHGAVRADWRLAIDDESAYLAGLMSRTRRALRDGWTLAQAVERIEPPDAAQWRLTEPFHRRNVTAAYAELEWDDDATAAPAAASANAASAAGGRRAP